MLDMDYQILSEQIKAIISKEMPLISNLSNVSALLNKLENINWCGFYLANKDYLYLGPFQGEVACIRIAIGKGVCGKAFLKKETLVVDNVNEFPGHIACSALSKSEIVVPIILNDEVKAVIDIDSPIYNRFSEKDKIFLEQVANILKDLFNE